MGTEKVTEHKGVSIDVSSKMVEKAIDLAKDFLDKLIMPSVAETGLLLTDQVTFVRFKRQVATLNKAKAICEKHNISPKTISLKLLCPLLDNAALEDDEYLQDKWAILLSNLIDSEQNIQSHVFPYILSQISSREFAFMREFVNKHFDKVKSDQLLEKSLNLESMTPMVDISNLKGFEVANLVRLGLLRDRGVAEPDRYYVIRNPDSAFPESSYKYRKVITELGALFIVACEEKSNSVISEKQ